jgi:hypothetical protein
MVNKLVFNKKWYESKTVWAAGAALVIAVLTAMFGETSPVVAVVIAALSALGIYSRVTATAKLQ